LYWELGLTIEVHWELEFYETEKLDRMRLVDTKRMLATVSLPTEAP